MARKLALLALLPAFAAVAFGVAFLLFYRGGYDPPPDVEISYEEITWPQLPAGAVVDSPATQVKRGLVLVDTMHNNSFSEAEFFALNSRIASRGYEVEFVGAFTPQFEELRHQLLEEKLRRADSLVVILPQLSYSEAEATLVERFVQKGGRLLLVSDPARPQQTNTLATRFGVEFRPDYLYNVSDYDLVFQNIIVREFQPGELTVGLDAITLYTAGSIRTSGPGLAFAGPGTESSVVETSEPLYPIAGGDSRNVLAIADFTFLVPPQNSLLDNDRLISNIADYLTSSEREYHLTDFPHFYETGTDNAADILLGQPSLWDVGIQMKNGLSTYGIPSEIRGAEDLSRDTVFLGLYDDALPVSRYLQAAGVRVGDTIGTPFAPDLDLQGTTVTVLDQNQDRYVLVVLADSPWTLTGAVDSLLAGEFRGDLVTDYAGVGR
ncbi:MAG: DUF4350 domain-containing protein [Chloroflexota bacterium]|nr:DUF4350 domain-containing protein [Chloroflexota bacterium]MDE2884112.1 DUF4350 domain-containing protein [Chloroflexota bacterium]